MSKKKPSNSVTTMDISRNSMFLYGQDLECWTPDSVRAWTKEHGSNQALADMTAQVSQHLSLHEQDSYDDGCEADAYKQWLALYRELANEILTREGLENSNVGWLDKMAPFMEAQGYKKADTSWISASNDTKRPTSVYVGVDVADARKGILGLFQDCELIEHYPDEEKYEYLDEGEIEHEIKKPDTGAKAWLILPEGYGEITFGMHDWHSHYDWFEYDLQYLEWEIKGFLSGSRHTVSIYAGDEWLGSSTYDGNVDDMAYQDFLKLFHFPPEFKEDLKEKGGRIEVKGMKRKNDRTLYSDGNQPQNNS